MTTDDNIQHVVEDGLNVAYYTHDDGTVHRYEETAEKDSDGLAVYDYTGQVAPVCGGVIR